jgi:hypothetical protein
MSLDVSLPGKFRAARFRIFRELVARGSWGPLGECSVFAAVAGSASFGPLFGGRGVLGHPLQIWHTRSNELCSERGRRTGLGAENCTAIIQFDFWHLVFYVLLGSGYQLSAMAPKARQKASVCPMYTRYRY